MFEDSKEKKSSNTACDIKNVIKISLFGQFQYSDFILLEEMLGLRPHSPLQGLGRCVCWSQPPPREDLLEASVAISKATSYLQPVILKL